MNLQQRLEQLPNQERSYSEGNVEYIHDQWILFDEQDEPISLNDRTKSSFEIYMSGKWVLFEQFDHGVAYGQQSYPIKQGDTIRFQKQLLFTYQEWLSELTDESIERFVVSMNKLQYSIYDCIYCHNFLFFNVKQKPKNGVNFLVFDNGEQICAVQHHFKRDQRHIDRFEITLNDGTRQLLMNTSK
ncbi:DUF2777 family protein [Bacillus sp. DJP31]|uniref:DUF2777 family protein n=1 Tax=Bacillus sp. DJP31 TaxID=3409789 RepID=UPI003BB5DAC8